MSCFPPNYNPIPPRVWHRVTNICPVNPYLNTELAKTYDDVLRMEYKANILKNKDNSSNYTKNQRYSKIVQGKWQNRTKSFASQTTTYTNPNPGLFERNNVTKYISVPISENPNHCFNTNNSSSIPDGGYLVGNKRVNQCTGVTIQETTYPLCFPTSCSDVPSTSEVKVLCYNNTNPQLNYTRKRYTMNTSFNKWPQNYKFSIAPQFIT
jgi:hypothetical protein